MISQIDYLLQSDKILDRKNLKSEKWEILNAIKEFHIFQTCIKSIKLKIYKIEGKIRKKRFKKKMKVNSKVEK